MATLGEESAAAAAGLGRKRALIGMPLPPPPIIQLLRPRLLPVASPGKKNLYRKLCQQRYYVVVVVVFFLVLGAANISIPREGGRKNGRVGEL